MKPEQRGVIRFGEQQRCPLTGATGNSG